MDQLIAAGETAPDLNIRGDVAEGSDGDDFIYGTDARAGLFGNSGNDYVDAGAGDDEVYGGSLILFRKKLKYQSIWRRFSEQENLRRAA